VYRRYITRYADAITTGSLSTTAYERIKDMIVRVELAPGAVVREDDLQARTGIGRTPIREALQRLERDQLVTVIPRRGVMVTPIDLGDLALLYETRAILEPYVHRLAARRGTEAHWRVMQSALDRAGALGDGAPWDELLRADRVCHEQVWAASDNRFLTQTLEMLYTQSERLWHQYVRNVADLWSALDEHRSILAALRAGDGDAAAELIDGHVRSFERQTRAVLYDRLQPPLRS
jgi:DNA-binding GntR family transcriptional regulator